MPLAAGQLAVMPGNRGASGQAGLLIHRGLLGDNCGAALADHDQPVARELAESPLHSGSGNALKCLQIADGRDVRPGRQSA